MSLAAIASITVWVAKRWKNDARIWQNDPTDIPRFVNFP